MKKVFFIIIIFILQENVYSQKEYFNWLFGNEAGISFVKDINQPEIFLSSKLVSMEGSASISDQNGNLLFYTNGVTVWNRNHDTMPNGTKLLGHVSSPQAALIIKSLNFGNIYYIFTVDAKENYPLNGLCYSVVDLNLDNGMGDVTSKNILLHKQCSEKLTAIMNAKQNGYWIISHHNDKSQFFAFELTKSGINEPMISEVGNGKIDVNSAFPYNTGYLKFSPNGEKLASSSTGNNMIEIFDFNRETGLFSNPIVIYDFEKTFPELNDTTSSVNPYSRPYGLEFSPNNNYLFATFSKGIIQFDLVNMAIIDFNHRRPNYTLIDYFNNTMGGLQLGPDNKIYVSLYHEQEIGVIKSPNLNKFNNYNLEKIGLISGICNLSLTNIITPLKENAKLKFTVVNNDFCDGDSTILYANLDYPRKYKYLWSTGDTTNYITIKSSGFYWVEVKVGNAVYALDSIYITEREKPKAKILNNGINVICEGEEVLLTADPYDFKYTYEWSTGDRTKSVKVKDKGVYKLKITNNYGCWDTTSIFIDVNPKPKAKIESNGKKSICKGEVLVLNASPEGNEYTYEWSTGAKTKSINVSYPGIYELKVKNQFDCIEKVSIKITENKRPQFTIKTDGDNQICIGLKEEIQAISADKSLKYLWSTGVNSDKIEISNAGKYIVTAVDSNGCTSVDSIIIFKREIFLDHPKEIDFGKSCVGSILNFDVKIENRNSEQIRIRDISLKKFKDDFIISNFTEYMTGISSQTVSIQFLANSILDYSDSLIIRVTEPCLADFAIPIKAISYAKVLVFTTDTVASINETFGIPVYAAILCGSKVKDTLNGKISFLKTLLEPYKFQEEGINIVGINNNLLLSNLTKLLSLKMGDTNLIGAVKGNILLAEENKIPVNLSNFLFNNNLIEVVYLNGSVEIQGLCAKDLARIQIISNYLSISPNPATDFIEVNVGAGSKPALENPGIEIYNIFGELQETSPQTPLLDERGLKIDISNLTPGVYLIKISDRFEKFVKM